MQYFRKKEIHNCRTLGEIFSDQRQTLCVDMKKAARDTKISSDYLSMIESGRFDLLPGDVYARNFVKTYAKYLGLCKDKMVEIFDNERTVQKNIHLKKQTMKEPAKIMSRFNFLVAPKIARNLIVFFIVMVCLSYIGIKVDAIIRPPDLYLITPITDVLVNENSIEIRGMTEAGSRVEVNEKNVFVDEEGKFQTIVSLKEGINEVEVRSYKNHSKESVVKRRVVVK